MLTERDKNILTFINECGGITVNQCGKIFFSDAKFAGDLARKRLKKLADNKELHYGDDWATNQRIYYLEKKPSSHTIKLLDLIAELTINGAKIIRIDKEPKLDNCRPDALILFSHNDKGRMIFVEVDMSHNTDLKKYSRLYESSLVQNEYGTFPVVVILCPDDKVTENKKYKFKVVRMNYKLDKIKENLLIY